MKKWQIENSEKSEIGNLGNLENIFRVFLFPSFCQNQKLGFKNIGRKSPRPPRFLKFPSFRPGRY